METTIDHPTTQTKKDVNAYTEHWNNLKRDVDSFSEELKEDYERISERLKNETYNDWKEFKSDVDQFNERLARESEDVSQELKQTMKRVWNATKELFTDEERAYEDTRNLQRKDQSHAAKDPYNQAFRQ